MNYASHSYAVSLNLNINDSYQTDGTGVFFHFVMPKNSFGFYFKFYYLIMYIFEMDHENWIDWR